MASAKVTTDHDEIRKWVEARGGHPAHVKRTSDDGNPGVLRIDYPGFSGAGTLERIDWDQFFEWFDRDKLAFLYQDERDSRFSKLVDRSAAKGTRARGRAGTRQSAAKKRTTAKKASAAKRASSVKKTSTATKTSAAKKTSRAKTTTPAKRSAAKPRSRVAAKPTTKPRSRVAAKPTTRPRSRVAASPRAKRAAKRTTSHNTIRRWVEARGGYPARVKSSGRGKDPGILRIDYPGFSGQKTLQRIEWDEFFDWFDRDKLAFLYQDTPRSRFSKLVSR